ncbi:hypothetical protein BD324DRAFT_577947 [Kockovaella imperatae]|uniref:Oxysterol-binding protein n=1 Tax=Kockovaella imperatae TaxID=4999 RepID=A0A1Y1UKI2_9TREE|nr:hypothetical protein BD324DRAFT_577947 [Kockovaella imperatae]ORX38558.1 hypothetical protein BD324DRAFT_577947 [Kockovaella imperatae]
MGLLSNSMDSLARSKSRSKSDAGSTLNDAASAAPSESGSVAGDGHDTTNLDKDQGNVLMAIVQQLRPGMDLSKIALPTFVLEPRSLLERITDFFSHPELIFGQKDEKERFIRVMTFYLSGWHIKPKGVKKPYNPVLGEFFRCSYIYEDGTEGFYVAEQVSHHPPVSAFFYCSPKNGLMVTGELKPKSKFLGNSAATIMEGEDRIRLLNKPEDGDYVITMPNTYARGILFGKMTLELCDVSTITCENTDYHCDVDFKAKGWISGGYNSIHGAVRVDDSSCGEVSGHWSDTIYYQEKKSSHKRVLFDPSKTRVVPKSVLPEAEQEEYESRRLWTKLTDAIKAADMHGATAAKTAVEDRQRELVRQREAKGESPPAPRFFKHVEGDKWMPSIGVDSLPKDPLEMESALRQWIFGDRSPSKDHASIATPMKSSSDARKAQPVNMDNVNQSLSHLTVGSPPAKTTAPGPPAPGPKFDHPTA